MNHSRILQIYALPSPVGMERLVGIISEKLIHDQSIENQVKRREKDVV